MNKSMIWIKNLLKLFFSITIIVFGLEIGSSIFIKEDNSLKINKETYSLKERDSNLPFILEKNGSKCIRIISSFNWNQWWGFSQKKLDISCAKKHFDEDIFSVVFMGGSAMYNAEAPNYLTHIDYLATKDLDKVRTINLSETGARHFNMSIRFQRELLQIKPNLVIFFDGFNEYASIRYQGNPANDYYWTVGGYTRMHKPYKIYIEKLIEHSSFFELLLLRSGFYKSVRNITKIKFDPQNVKDSSSFYLNDIMVTKNLCNNYNIKCLFIIQPHIFGSNLSEHLEIISKLNQSIPNLEKIHTLGYNTIIKSCEFCIDASKLLHDKPNTFIDAVHFSKNGSKVIGDFLNLHIKKQMN